MPITGEDAERIIEHALAGVPQGRAPVESAIQLANDAGHWLLSARDWNWASGARATLDLTATEAFIELPEDFQAFIGSPFQQNSTIGGFEWTSLPTLIELVTTAPTAAGHYFYGALAWDQSGDGAPVPRIELHPTPNSTVAGALACFYRRGWTEYPSPADTTEAKLPEWMNGLYVATLQAFARGWEDDLAPQSARQQYLTNIMLGPEWAVAVRRDSVAQPNVGFIKNGILSARGRHWSRVLGVEGPT